MKRLLVVLFAASLCAAEPIGRHAVSSTEMTRNGITVQVTIDQPARSLRSPYPNVATAHVALRSEHATVDAYDVTLHFTRAGKHMSRTISVEKAPGLDWSAVAFGLEPTDSVTGVAVVERAPAEHFQLND